MRLEGRQIVCASSLPWEGLQTSRHHLARHLAAENDVLFIDPPENLARVGGRRRRPLTQVEDRIWVASSPPHLPYGPPLLFVATTALNQRRYAAGVAASLDDLGWRHPVLWNASFVYAAPTLAGAIQPCAHVFHLTDSIWDMPWYRPAYDRILDRILADADVALACTPELVDRLSGRGTPVHHLPHGVDPGRFRAAMLEQEPVPDALASRARPRLGFVGKLEQRLDIDVLETLAGDVGSVTLVGPNELSPEQTARLVRAGCHLDGPVPYAEVPRWLAGFDIALVPYRPTRLVETSRPLKLLEYLAAGLPVVATDIPAVRELAPEVASAVGRDGFARAVADLYDGTVVGADRAAARQRRAGRVSHLTWRRLAERLGDRIADVVDARS